MVVYFLMFCRPIKKEFNPDFAVEVVQVSDYFYKVFTQIFSEVKLFICGIHGGKAPKYIKRHSKPMPLKKTF